MQPVYDPQAPDGEEVLHQVAKEGGDVVQVVHQL